MTEREATVFVVDDDVSVRRGLERLLRATGHRVETFGSAREFLTRHQGELYGCLLLDVRMPDMTGPELQAALAAQGRDIPIIFITGHADVAAGQAPGHPAADFLTKPFDEDVLFAAVSRALARVRPGRAERRIDAASP